MPLDKQGDKFPYRALRESRDLALNNGRHFCLRDLRVLTDQAPLDVGDQRGLVGLRHEDSVRPQTTTVNRYLRSSSPS